MTIPVIILNYNSSADSRKCVSFLKRQEGVELEIVLVDNYSRPNDLEQLRTLARDEGCTLLESKENRGYNAGNNIGLRYAAAKGYEYALIANPDMEFPQTDYVARLAEAMERDEDVVVVGSDIVGLDGVHQSPLKRHNTWLYSFNWVGVLFRKKTSKPQNVEDFRNSHYCWKVSGCCFLVRMSFVQQIGYFDEYPFLYCEESILTEQVYAAKKREYYVADIQAVHAHVKSQKGDLVKRLTQWKRSRFYYIDHYSGDTMVGRKIAKLSLFLYIASYELFRKIKRFVKW